MSSVDENKPNVSCGQWFYLKINHEQINVTIITMNYAYLIQLWSPKWSCTFVTLMAVLY